MYQEYPIFIQEGWRCPQCQKILSPHMSFCPFCNNREVKRTTTTTQPSIDDSEWWNEYLKRSTTAKTTKDLDDLIKSTADSASIINPTTTWTSTSSPPNTKITAWNSTTTCSQKCEECDKYEKSCFGGVETTDFKTIISHRKPPKVTFDFDPEDTFDTLIKHFRA